jgi:hypothetical protein
MLQWNGQNVRYKDIVTLFCNRGYSPIEQNLYCDETGTLETPDPCGLMKCGELYTDNAEIQCTTGARTSPSQDMVYGKCDPEALNAWETFQYPNEFYIMCNPGFQHFPAPPAANPETKCTINGSYTPFPQCLDFNECEADVFGPVISFEEFSALLFHTLTLSVLVYATNSIQPAILFCN